MPYKCTVCGRYYREGSKELKKVMIDGKCVCGKRFLSYIKSPLDEDIFEKIEESKKEEFVKEKIGEAVKQPDEFEDDAAWWEKRFIHDLKQKKPIILGIETIRRIEEGEFELDIESLMRGKPIIVKAEEGIYYIDVPYAMKKKK